MVVVRQQQRASASAGKALHSRQTPDPTGESSEQHITSEKYATPPEDTLSRRATILFLAREGRQTCV